MDEAPTVALPTVRNEIEFVAHRIFCVRYFEDFFLLAASSYFFPDDLLADFLVVAIVFLQV